MDFIYFAWLTIAIFVAHYVTDVSGVEAYAVKNKLGYLALFAIYWFFLVAFDFIWLEIF